MLFEVSYNTKLRHEWKHLITPSDRQVIIQRLSCIASPDLHYGAEDYHIRSLYFDNVYDKALAERLNGQEVREKFRIRYYNNNPEYIVLEKKSKYNMLCGKIGTQITREQCQQIMNGEITWLRETKDPLCVELYAKMHSQLLRPRVIVDYRRRAFTYPCGNVRITIDDEIRSGLSCVHMFEPFVSIPADIRHPVILEVKYDEYLPDIIRDAIQLNDRRTTSFSKYTACRLTNY